MTEEHKGKRKGVIRTDFHGLIELLAKNLYPQEDVFIRELIQNAHDAILRRETLETSPPAGRIEITTDRASKTITFRDNGAGMTQREIDDYLSTIFRSGTGELREQLKERDRDRAQNLIGQFGIGVLSAFVVAERLVVDTYSGASNETGWRWSVSGGPDYEVEPIKMGNRGTTVAVYLKPACLALANADTLTRAVRKYADFLPFPIYVNGQGPVNTMQAPWHRGYSSDAERKKTYWGWVNERFPDIPLEIIPVDIDAPHLVRGVLYVSDRHIPDVNMAGMVDIYQARMFICQGARNLLPLWAKFIRGVIDSPALTPTAARDAVREDPVHDEIRVALGRLIIEALKALAKDDPARFRRLMEWHHFHIKGMAVHFDDFFQAIADTVIFEVNLPDPKDKGRSFRMLTIPEYLELQKETDTDGHKILYYISEHGAAPQFYRLCQAKGLLAVNAGLVFEEEFLEKYTTKYRQDVTLRRIDIAEGTAIFEPLSKADRVQYLDLEYRLSVLLRGALPDQETSVQTERFAPPEIPAVLTQTKDAEIADRLQRLVIHPAMSGALGDAMREALGIQRQRLQPIVVHLNVTSHVIERLRREDFDDPVVQDAWMAVYNNAFMYSRHYLSVQNLEVLHAQTVRALENVLALREEQRRLKAQIDLLNRPNSAIAAKPPIRRTPHISLFASMPFGEQYDMLERALRQVLEDDPYYFQVILARDRTLHSNLFDNVKAHMRLVHGFLADVSDLNPNVMLELGITEADAEERPVIILRRSGSKESPADLRGRLYIEYDLPSKKDPQPAQHLVAHLREKFDVIDAMEQLRRNRGVRYLSSVHLQRRCGQNRLTKEEAERVCRTFATIEQLEGVDKVTLKQKTDLEDVVVAMIGTAFGMR